MSEEVQRRPLGSSGLEITPLVLGGNVFGWTADRDASFAALDAFVDGGGTMIDTADVYSAWAPGHEGGESETMIGEWLAQSGKRDRVQIATKVGMMDGGLRPDRIASAIDASLRRLQSDHVDLYFAHQDDQSVPLAEVLGAFARLIEAGKVRAIGASNYGALRLKEAIDTAAAGGLPHFSVLQPSYSLVTRSRFEGELQDLCIQHNIGVVPYAALAGGFLTGKYRSAEDLGQSVRGGSMTKLLEGRGPAVLAAIDAVVADTGATHAQVALAWLAAQPGVTAPIASATSRGQLEELLGAMRLTLTDDQIAHLDAAGG